MMRKFSLWFLSVCLVVAGCFGVGVAFALEEPVLPEALAAARTNANPNLADLAINEISSNLRDPSGILHGTSYSEGGFSMTAPGQWLRSEVQLRSPYLSAETVQIGEQEISTGQADVYLRCEFSYTSSEEYRTAGMMIGKTPKDDGGVRYYSLVLEPGRGCVFLYFFDLDATGNATYENKAPIIYTPLGSFASGKTYVLEMIKRAENASVYLDGTIISENFSSVYAETTNEEISMTNIMPLIGASFCDISATVSGFCYRYLAEGARISGIQEKPTPETSDYLAGVGALTDENGVVSLPVQAESWTAAEDYEAKFYLTQGEGDVWVADGEDYRKVSASELPVLLSAKITLGTYAAQDEFWHGAGLVFRRGDHTYAVRILKDDSLVLMEDGNNLMTRTLPKSAESGVSYIFDILTEEDKVTVWVDGMLAFHRAQIGAGANAAAFWTIMNGATLSDVSGRYLEQVWYKNPDPSADAALSDLSYDGETLEGFDADTYEYRLEFPAGSVPDFSKLTYVVRDVAATAQRTEDENTVSIVVTAEDETTVRTYVVRFEVRLFSDATLSELKYGGTSVADFDPGVFIYTVHLDAGIKGPEKDEIAYVLAESHASAEVALNGLQATITVTAQDGTILTYTLNFLTDLSDVSTLSGLTINNVSLKDFSADKTSYTFEYEGECPTGADVRYTLTDDSATAAVMVEDGVAKVTVTAENGSTTVYIVTLTQKPAAKGCGGGASAAALALFLVLALPGIKRR